MVELLCIFVFQAEDGIRDLVRSRGLGDVYKRQLQDGRSLRTVWRFIRLGDAAVQHDDLDGPVDAQPVSYTHLTLPTSDLV